MRGLLVQIYDTLKRKNSCTGIRSNDYFKVHKLRGGHCHEILLASHGHEPQGGCKVFCIDDFTFITCGDSDKIN